MIKQQYESWGRYPLHKPKHIERVFWRSEIPNLCSFDSCVLPRGLSKSYGDSCQNSSGSIIDMSGMNHLIDFNNDSGVIRAESGFTLKETLDLIVPRGWFPASTPGTKHITIGGAIANDVHGKNHHRNGTFGCHVTKFELLRSNGETLICSPLENTDMFNATIGGLGLTGLITWAEFKTQKCPSPFIAMDSIKFNNIEEFFDINEQSDKEYDYTVSWVDCTASGGNLGRGIFSRGNHADPKLYELPKLPKEKVVPFPFDAPFINPLTVNLFNKLYFHKQLNEKESSIVHYNNFFYPLDAVNEWNKAYGKKGFLQYQFVIPLGSGLVVLKDILQHIASSGMSSFLTVLKTFGDVKSPGMLSFPEPGVTMAVDFRMDGRRTLDKLNELDKLVISAGGKLYPAKDARMEPENFKRFYPNWKEFSKYIDPKFSSSFWRRVTA